MFLLRAFLVQRKHSCVVDGIGGCGIQAVREFWEETNKSLDKFERGLMIV